MRVLFLPVLVLSATGCSWLINDHDNDYLQSEIKPNIRVSADVASVNLQPQLPIPSAKKIIQGTEFVLPRPHVLRVSDGSENESASLAEVEGKTLESNLLKDGNGTPILRLNVGFARAWAALGDSLKKADISITDLNRSIGTYYIELEKESPVVELGFWASLFSSTPEAEKLPLQVKLNRARSGVYIAVHENFEKLAQDQQAQSLLSQIQETL